MPILDAVKERLEPALETAKERLARGAERVARADLTADEALSGLVDATRKWLAPRVEATRERLAPRVAAAKERMTPVAEAAKERLAPVIDPLTPVIGRVKEAASEFGEIAVGSAPEAEEVPDPVGELRTFFDVQDTVEIEPLTASSLPAGQGRAVRESEDEELEVPPYEPWALSTLEEAPESKPVRPEPERPRERATFV